MKVLTTDNALVGKYNFSYLDNYKQYLIRYIDDGYDSENYDTYKTLYVNTRTRDIFAYNDMWDKKIPMKNKYIEDLLKMELSKSKSNQ